MLQRVNLALIVVVGLALGWGVYSTGSVQTRNSEALAAMAQKLDVMAGSGRGVVPVTAEPARPSAVVYLSGNVSNPGAFNMSDETFTVRRLLAAAGAGAAPGRVAIRGADGTLRAELSGPELAAVDGRDVPLLANDTVVVE